MLSVVVAVNEHRMLITKGAPESVVPLCSCYSFNDREEPLDKDRYDSTCSIYRQLNIQGYRVLAVAYRDVPAQAAYNKNVDETYIQKPKRWDISLIRKFMIYIGSISSVFDFLTFFVMLKIFNATEALFHTGWFVESLATQTLILFVIRTVGNPLRSRPSLPLTITTITIVIFGSLLPFTPLAHYLGFTPLPIGYFLFLVLAVAAYMLLVQWVKMRLMGRVLKIG